MHNSVIGCWCARVQTLMTVRARRLLTAPLLLWEALALKPSHKCSVNLSALLPFTFTGPFAFPEIVAAAPKLYNLAFGACVT